MELGIAPEFQKRGVSLQATVTNTRGTLAVRPHEHLHNPEAFVANSKYFALPWQGPEISSALGIIDQLAGTGTIDQIHVPILEAHTSAISDFQFNPFNDDIIVSVGHDRAMNIWRLDEILSREDAALAIRKSSMRISIEGGGRPSSIKFHPSASNLAMVVCGVLGDRGDSSFKFYDLAELKQDPSLEYKRSANDFVMSAQWSFDGTSVVAVGMQHRRLECFDPRSKEKPLTSEQATHESYNKPVKVLTLRDLDRAVTLGHSLDGALELSVWDLRNPKFAVSRTCIDREPGPSSVASLLDVESNLLYLSTRGDRDVDVLKLEPESGQVFHVNTYRSLGVGTTQAIAMMPKAVCDFGSAEVTRLARISNNQIGYIRFKINNDEGDDSVKTLSSSVELRASSEVRTTLEQPSIADSDLSIVSVAGEMFPDIILREPSLAASEWIFLKQNGWPKSAPLSGGGNVAIRLSRLIASSEFSDCQIRLSDQEGTIPAHRCILSCRSAVLKNMLMTAQYRSENTIILDASRTAVDAALLYIYTDSIPRLRFAAAAKEVLHLAEQLELDGMVAMLLREQPSLAELIQTKPRNSASSYLRDLYRLMNDGRSYFSDLEICSAHMSFPAHRAVIATRSPFFHKMLTSGFQEEREGRIVLQDLGESELKAILASLYIGRPSKFITPDNVLEIWLAATQHDLAELSQACEKYIRESVDTDNVVPLFLRAEMIQSSHALRKFLINYMTSFWDIVSSNPGNIAELDPKHIALIQQRRPVQGARFKLFGGK